MSSTSGPAVRPSLTREQAAAAAQVIVADARTRAARRAARQHGHTRARDREARRNRPIPSWLVSPALQRMEPARRAAVEAEARATLVRSPFYIAFIVAVILGMAGAFAGHMLYDWPVLPYIYALPVLGAVSRPVLHRLAASRLAQRKLEADTVAIEPSRQAE